MASFSHHSGHLVPVILTSVSESGDCRVTDAPAKLLRKSLVLEQ